MAIKIGFSATFLALICAPSLLLFSGTKPYFQIIEKRKLGSLPPLNFSALHKTFSGFERYFQDHFGLRNELIVFNRALRFFLLSTSGSDKVLIGRNGWLIFRLHPDLKETRRLALFSEEELKKWGAVYQARSDYAKQNGAVYLLVVAPDPKTIYPEILPDWIPPPGETSRMDQIYNYLALNHPDVNFLDLRPVLSAHRDEPIYFHTDTHWTTLGAYYAYREIMNSLSALKPNLAQAFIPAELSDFESVPIVNSGDLAQMLGLPTLIQDKTIDLRPKQPWQSEIRDRPIDNFNFVTVNHSKPNAPRLTIFRDSYAIAMQGLLAQHFSYAHFRWHYGFERKLVKRDKPDVVIQMFVEREMSEDVARAFSRN